MLLFDLVDHTLSSEPETCSLKYIQFIHFIHRFLSFQALLELGASPNYRDCKGLTPLYHLSKKRNSPALCAELLLRDYALIGCKDETGNTELHHVRFMLVSLYANSKQ